MLSIFLLAPPDGPCSLSFTRGGKRFLTRLKSRHLKQDLNISPFVNHFMLRNPWALDTFLYANQMKMYT